MKNVGSARTFVVWVSHTSLCLKMPKKVSFYIASEASYVYILSKESSSKIQKKLVNLESFWKPEDGSQTVLPDR